MYLLNTSRCILFVYDIVWRLEGKINWGVIQALEVYDFCLGNIRHDRIINEKW